MPAQPETRESGPGDPDDRSTPPPTSALGPSPTAPASEETVAYQADHENPESGRVAADLTQAFGQRYELQEKLGQGGFGSVYRGYDRQLQRPVAIKVSRVDRTTSASADQLLREARQIAQLRHPGIVAVHDVTIANGRCLIVSELLRGSSLSQWIRTNRTTWLEAVGITAKLADAIAHAHARSIIHRDIKPSNILIVEDQPVLVDFGLALSDQDSDHRRGDVMGTPAYMSPEQARGEAHLPDGRTDIYSLGVTLYEMLSGRRPFRATDTGDLLRKIQHDDPQPLRQIRPELPPELERVCARAMAKSLAERYPTASDFAQDLRALLAAPPAGHTASTAPRQAVETRTAAVSTPGSSSHSSTRREPERRQITVLYCTVSQQEFENETLLENAHAQLAGFHEICRRVTDEQDGHVLPATGLQFLACFGFPMAHEDAPRRAVSAALRIVHGPDGGGPDQTGSGISPLRISAAVHTGPAIVSEEPGAPLSVLGEVMTSVSRLEDLFSSGEVLISEATHRLVNPYFECHEAGSVKVRGSSRPLEAYRVSQPRAVRNRVEASVAGGLTPLIGRAREVDLLLERWQDATEGMAPILCLVGDPGLGKSRLLQVVRDHILGHQGADGAGIIEWYCSPYHQSSQLYPAIEFLERSFQIDRAMSAASRLDILMGRLASAGVTDPQSVALFASLLSIPLDHRVPPLTLSPERQRERTLEILIEWIRQLAGQTPVLFIVEDLHWVDPSTLELLDRFVEMGGESSTLALFTYRPEFSPPWRNSASVSQVALNRLTKRQVGEMMRAQSGQADIAQSLVDQIVDRTDGVPLFVEEFTRLLAESDVRWQGSKTDESTVRSLAIPATLQDLLVARLDRMASLKEVVQLGAAIGRSFSFELIRSASDLDETTLRLELEKLVEAGLLFVKGAAPKSTYTFKHALIQDAAYFSLIQRRRHQFHQRIGESLEQAFPEVAEIQPDLLAHHFTEAGQTDRAIDYWLRAGLRSRGASANPEAIRQLARGLELLLGRPASAERDHRELAFRLPLSASLIAVRGYGSSEVEQQNEAALRICERLGAGGPLFHLKMVIWAVRFIRGQIGAAETIATELLTLAEHRGDDGYRTEARWAAGCTAWWAGDFPAAQSHLETAHRLYRLEASLEHSRFTQQNSGPLLIGYEGLALWSLGFADQARARMVEAVALAEQLGDPFTLAVTLWEPGLMAQLAGDGRGALTWADRILAISEEQSFAFWIALGIGLKGAALSLLGRHREAIPLLEDSIRRVEATGCEKLHQNFLGMLAESHWQEGRTEQAWQALDGARAINDRDRERYLESELYRRRARFLAESEPGRVDAIESCLARAIETAERQRARFFELRCLADLVRWRKGRPGEEEVRTRLRQALDGFVEGLDSADWICAKSVLDDPG